MLKLFLFLPPLVPKMAINFSDVVYSANKLTLYGPLKTPYTRHR